MEIASKKKFRSLLSLFLAQALIAQGAMAGDAGFQGKVVEVIDGATIRVNAPEGDRVVRLAGVESAGLDSQLGREAKQKLAAALMGKTVTVRGLSQNSGSGLAERQGASSYYGQDAAERRAHADSNQPYNGRVFLDGQDIAMILISAGLAWLIYNILHDNTLKNQQSEAMRNRSGVWSSATSVSSDGRPVNAGASKEGDSAPALESSEDGYKQKDISGGKKANPGLHLGWDKKKNKKSLEGARE